MNSNIPVNPVEQKKNGNSALKTILECSAVGLVAVAVFYLFEPMFYRILGESFLSSNNFPMAEEALTISSQRGNTAATIDLFKMSINGQTSNVDNSEIFNLVSTAAELEDPEAMNQMGLYYADGVFVEKNMQTAQEWYLKAAEAGNLEAMFHLARIFETGSTGEQNMAKALEWYKKASDNGDTALMKIVAKAYYDGTAVPQDFNQAFQWYLKAAEAGDPESMVQAGLMYTHGQGTEQNYHKAEEWFQHAVNNGNEEGQYYLDKLFKKQFDF